MRILCVIDSLGSGGAQRQLVTIGKELKGRGHDVSFLVYHKSGFYSRDLEAALIPVVTLPETGYFKRILNMRRVIRGGKYDVVLSFLQTPNFIATLSGFPFRRWRLILGERSANPNILKSLKLRFYRYFHLFADYIVANSHSNLDLVRKVNPFISDSKCKVIYNVVSLPFSRETVKPRGGVFRLIIGASHRKLKNLNGLIEGVRLLPDSHIQTLRIDWYGEKDLDSSFSRGKDRIKEYNLEHVFNFHDPTNRILDEMVKADAAGLFSYYEGFPNFLCESMAFGLPIVCTNISDLPLILKDGLNCFFCEPDSPQKISDALLALMDSSTDELLQMSSRNKDLVKKLFDEKIVVDAYLDLFVERKKS